MLPFVEEQSEIRKVLIPADRLKLNPFSLSIYGDPRAEIDDLIPSIREFGILVPLVVAPDSQPGSWEVISGHRRFACALALGLSEVPCELYAIPMGDARRVAILEFNRHRRKTFSQLMREADALEKLWSTAAKSRSLGNLRRTANVDGKSRTKADRRNSDDREAVAKPDAAVASHLYPHPPDRAELIPRSRDILEWAARIYFGRHVLFGGLHKGGMCGRKAESPSLITALRQFTRHTRTCAAAIGSV